MPDSIAIFWDFTQLHESLISADTDGGQYRVLPDHTQPEVVDIDCILQSVDNLGRVTLNRAYADWRPFGKYADVLAEAPLELIQVFTARQPGGLSRSLSADVIDYLGRSDRAGTVVIVGGGSEYRQLRQSIQSSGTRLLGIGVEGVTDDFWIDTCDEFRFYHQMGCRKLYSGPPAGGVGMDRGRARDLLVTAMNHLARYYGTDWIQQVRIKPAIIRQDPDFDEAVIGYDAFSHFLRDQPDLIDRRHREGEQEPEYRLRPGENGSVQEKQPGTEQTVNYYLRTAGQQGIRMPDPVIMWEGIDVYASFLVDDITFNSFSEIDAECLRLLREDFPRVTLTEVKKVRQVLFKCFLFRPSVDDTIGFHEEIRGIEDIEDRYFDLMLARIGNNVERPLDYEALSIALTGSDKAAARLRRLNSEEE